MRRRLARLLRSAAHRLDPPRPVTTDPGEDVHSLFWVSHLVGDQWSAGEPTVYLDGRDVGHVLGRDDRDMRGG